ncbi:uncharacterized protein [Clytia hemisphaerica]|uniref:Uncharacterized protein n=1 Tax=Clytia hemisphaerica TaxID=252671 RepID=A0A7M5X9L9_9CNID
MDNQKVQELFKMIMWLAIVTDALTIECYDCSGTHAYCNNSRKTIACDGPQYSCLLSSSTTRVRVIKNGLLDYEVLTSVTKACGVETRSSYCKDKQDMDPNMLLCQTNWCYKDFCNFDLKDINKGAKTQSNQVDPYGWHKTSGAAPIKKYSRILVWFLSVVLLLLYF